MEKIFLSVMNVMRLYHGEKMDVQTSANVIEYITHNEFANTLISLIDTKCPNLTMSPIFDARDSAEDCIKKLAVAEQHDIQNILNQCNDVHFVYKYIILQSRPPLFQNIFDKTKYIYPVAPTEIVLTHSAIDISNYVAYEWRASR